MDCTRCLHLREDSCHGVPPQVRPVIDRLRTMPHGLCPMHETLGDLQVLLRPAPVPAERIRRRWHNQRLRSPENPSITAPAGALPPVCPSPSGDASAGSASSTPPDGRWTKKTRGWRGTICRVVTQQRSRGWIDALAVAAALMAAGVIIAARGG